MKYKYYVIYEIQSKNMPFSAKGSEIVDANFYPDTQEKLYEFKKIVRNDAITNEVFFTILSFELLQVTDNNGQFPYYVCYQCEGKTKYSMFYMVEKIVSPDDLWFLYDKVKDLEFNRDVAIINWKLVGTDN